MSSSGDAVNNYINQSNKINQNKGITSNKKVVDGETKKKKRGGNKINGVIHSTLVGVRPSRLSDSSLTSHTHSCLNDEKKKSAWPEAAKSSLTETN